MTNSAAVPSFEARYAFNPNVSAYAQVAEGYLAPEANFLYTTDANTSNLAPEKTGNYQTGMAYQSQRLALGAYVCIVDFTNYINSRTVGTNTIFYN
jgi:iron complex outermembrane receptor protein